MRKLLLLVAIITISLSATSQTLSELEKFNLIFADDDAKLELNEKTGVESVNFQIDVWNRKAEYRCGRIKQCAETKTLLDQTKPSLTSRRERGQWKAIDDNLKATVREIKHL